MAHEGYPRHIAYHPERDLLALSTDDTTEIQLLSPYTDEATGKHASTGHKMHLEQLRMHPTQPLALTSAADCNVLLWDLTTGEVRSSFWVPFMDGGQHTRAIDFSRTAGEFYAGFGRYVHRYTWSGEQLARSELLPDFPALVKHLRRGDMDLLVVFSAQFEPARVVLLNAQSLETLQDIVTERTYRRIDASPDEPSHIILTHNTGWDTLDVKTGSIERTVDYALSSDSAGAIQDSRPDQMLAIKHAAYGVREATIVDLRNASDLLDISFDQEVTLVLFGPDARWFVAAQEQCVQYVRPSLVYRTGGVAPPNYHVGQWLDLQRTANEAESREAGRCERNTRRSLARQGA